MTTNSCPNCYWDLPKCNCKWVVTCGQCQAARSSDLPSLLGAIAAFRRDHEPTHSKFITGREK